MNLNKIVEIIKIYSKSYPSVQEFEEGDIYQYLNSGEHKYPTTFLTITNISTGLDTQTINATIFYVDRLLDDSSNKLDVQTVGLTALKAIIEKITSTYGFINFTDVNYTPFTEKFSDLCAGVFAQCSIQINDELDCSSYDLMPLTIKENGVYDVMGVDQVIVDVTRVRTLGGCYGDIKLGKGLTMTDDGANPYLQRIDPTFEAGDNITITKDEHAWADNFRFDVPDMRYDDSEVKGMIEDLSEAIDYKVPITGEPSVIYGTDTRGNQAIYSIDEIKQTERQIVSGNAIACSRLKSNGDTLKSNVWQKGGQSYFFHEFVNFKRVPASYLNDQTFMSGVRDFSGAVFAPSGDSEIVTITFRTSNIGRTESLLIHIYKNNDFDIKRFILDEDYRNSRISFGNHLCTKTTSPHFEIISGMNVCVAKPDIRISPLGNSRELFGTGKYVIYRDNTLTYLSPDGQYRYKYVKCQVLCAGETVKGGSKKERFWHSLGSGLRNTRRWGDINETICHGNVLSFYRVGKRHKKSVYCAKFRLNRRRNVGGPTIYKIRRWD